MGTAERRLEIMKHLCRHRQATMTSMSKKFNVSIRTIQRDIFELTFMMPLDIKYGRYGGVYLIGNYTMDRVYMTANELELLIKIKKLVTNKLTVTENELLEYIISSYKKPSLN